MDHEYFEAFQTTLAHARKIEGISDIERTAAYEALKSKIYEQLMSGRTDLGNVAEEAVSWLRQNVQIQQSTDRLRHGA